MQTVFTGAFVLLLPSVFIVGLLLLSDRFQRRALAVVARQIAVTDAIHAELGAVVAPVVRHRLGGRWQIRIPVELDKPDTVTHVVRAAYDAFDARDRTRQGRFEIVLSPQEQPFPRRNRAAVTACATRGESVSWT